MKLKTTSFREDLYWEANLNSGACSDCMGRRLVRVLVAVLGGRWWSETCATTTTKDVLFVIVATWS